MDVSDPQSAHLTDPQPCESPQQHGRPEVFRHCVDQLHTCSVVASRIAGRSSAGGAVFRLHGLRGKSPS
jgi:hypothetical protein